MISPLIWNIVKFGLVSWLFVLLNLVLWYGPQDRAHSAGLKLLWAWWWPLILLSAPVFGRMWCAACPWMVWGEIAQKSTQALASFVGWMGLPSGWLQPRPWPHGDHDRWGAPLMAAGFALILLWEEVWDLQDTAWLSSCLLLLIGFGSVLTSLLFEKRFWCRYLCPVGGMNGLLAKLSIIELRAQQGTCSGSCTTYACLKGGPAEGEGMETTGCPHRTHPSQLGDNRNCIMCFSCVRACPHNSVQLRLRPPAADLQPNLHAPAAETGLILVLAGCITLHHWDRILGWLPLAPDSLQVGPLLPRLAFGALALSLPSLFGLWLQRRWMYAALPLLWAVMLARYLPLGMAEGATLLPSAWPQWSADFHVISFCQSFVIALGWIGTVLLLPRLITKQRLEWLLGSGVMLLTALMGRWLVA